MICQLDPLSQLPSNIFQQLVHLSTTPIVITSALDDFPIVYVNQAFVLTTGYTAEEVIGKNCRFLQGNDRDQSLIRTIKATLKQEITCMGYIKNYRRNGSLFWNRLSIFPIKNSLGKADYFVGIQQDVTSEFYAAIALSDRNKALAIAGNLYLKVNPQGLILEANELVANHFEMPLDTILNASICLFLPFQNVDLPNLLQRAKAAGELISVDTSYHNKQGARIIIQWKITRSDNEDVYLLMGTNITEYDYLQAQVNQSERRISSILESIHEGCFTLDSNWNFTFMNTQGGVWINREPNSLFGKNIWEEFPEAVNSTFFPAYHKAMYEREVSICEDFYEPLNMYFEARAYPMEEGITVFYSDITARKQSELALIETSTFDSLTTLLNRNSCLALIKESMKLASKDNSQLSLLFIDLDRFKEVNDTYGHDIGDETLKELGRRFKLLKTSTCIPARMSGDEFIFVLINTTSEDALNLAYKALDIIKFPIKFDSLDIVLGASIGISSSDGNLFSPDQLINHADTAMYSAKAKGRSFVNVYTEEMHFLSEKKLKIRRDLPNSLKNEHFVLFYQPQFDSRTLEIRGAEALIRWQHPEFGLLSPLAFIEIAEQSTVIMALGEWVFNEACRQLSVWNKTHAHFKMSMNISPRQFSDPSLSTIINSFASKHHLKRQNIKIEITESMLATDFDSASKTINDLRELGFLIALDDFGTGYSNFSYLNMFDVTTLKIDRSFITNIANDAKSLSILEGIIVFAKTLQLRVICEGVETIEQLQLIQRTDCDLIQGYLTGRPVEAERFFEKYLS